VAVCSAVVNNGLDSTVLEVFILGHCGPPSTGRIQQLAYYTNHKRGATKRQKLFNLIRSVAFIDELRRKLEYNLTMSCWICCCNVLQNLNVQLYAFKAVIQFKSDAKLFTCNK